MKDFVPIDWRVCTSPGPRTWSPDTGPAPPSSLSPVMLRQLARPTCTVASFLSCTQSHPTMCGQRTLTCGWTLPWKWVGVWGKGSGAAIIEFGTVHKTCVWMPLSSQHFWFHFQARSEASSRKGTLSSSWPAGVQALVTPTPCVWFWWLKQPKGLLTLPISIIHYLSQVSTPQSPEAHSSYPDLHSARWTIMQINDKCDIHLKELLWDGVEACSSSCPHSLHDFLSCTSFAGPSI